MPSWVKNDTSVQISVQTRKIYSIEQNAASPCDLALNVLSSPWCISAWGNYRIAGIFSLIRAAMKNITCEKVGASHIKSRDILPCQATPNLVKIIDLGQGCTTRSLATLLSSELDMWSWKEGHGIISLWSQVILGTSNQDRDARISTVLSSPLRLTRLSHLEALTRVNLLRPR